MTNEQARNIFNKAATNKTGDELAKIELLREYFTNQEFRKSLSDYLWELTNEK